MEFAGCMRILFDEIMFEFPSVILFAADSILWKQNAMLFTRKYTFCFISRLRKT